MTIAEQMKKWHDQPAAAHPEIVSIYNSQKQLPRGYKLTSNDAWCAASLTAAAIKCGLVDTICPECSAQKMFEGMTEVFDPKPEDFVFFDPDGNGCKNHVCVVLSGGSDVITTVEGNVGGKMAVRMYSISGYKKSHGEQSIRFCRPKAAKHDHSSCWGDAPLKWAVNMGIMSGDPDGNLRPHDTLTREEAAKMFMNAFRILGN